ncbi:ribokinase [Paenibacillus alginolyticus]|uniref:ribokinase n=1 Tax=Paenibacillus alginolyticus TaxID=59839 RepID=UPI000416FABC|nr:ribokinase [Paenibacillus alginolyticus]MCY9669535.1 ribokinase [Paenibacillus alginolyticus]
MKENIITVIGSLNFDIIFKQKRLAEQGETLTADSMTTAGGGKGANQAVQCAKLGAQTYLVGAVGSDAFGGYLMKELQLYGVHTDYVQTVEGNTGIGVVNALEDGTLVATISTGANYSLNKSRIDELEPLLKRSKVVILQLEIPIDVAEYAIEKASQNDCYIILNAAPAAPISHEVLSKVNCLVVNEPEATYYCGAAISDLSSAQQHCEKLFEKIKDLLIITLGKGGSLIYNGDEKMHVKAIEVKAKETTGAGDSYIGAFAYMLLEGHGIKEAALFASRAAGLTVTKIGGQPAMPTKAEIEQV